MHFFQFWEHSPSSRSSMCSAKYIYSMSSQCADKQWPYGTLSTRTPSPSSVPCQTPFSTTGPQTSGSLPLAAEDAECNLSPCLSTQQYLISCWFRPIRLSTSRVVHLYKHSSRTLSLWTSSYPTGHTIHLLR